MHGHTETIEVVEEVYEGMCELEKESRREEWRNQWRMRKKLISMDGLQEKGYQFEDHNYRQNGKQKFLSIFCISCMLLWYDCKLNFSEILTIIIHCAKVIYILE